VERTAETIGEDIAACEQAEIQRAMQLDLLMVMGEPIPILLYAPGWHGSASDKEGDGGRTGKRKENRRTHARSSWDTRLRRPRGMSRAAIRIRPPSNYG
jgi:hypothetical protein